ncbi:MAG: WD40 repeat domain-containing protein [Planctomycetota bacterium]
MLVTALLLGTAQAVEAAAKVDVHGDPLPPGAVCRMGTVRFHQRSRINGLCYSPDGKTIASGGDGREVIVWNAETGERIARLDVGHKVVYDLAFSPGGKLLAAACEDGTVRAWETAGERKLFHQFKGHKGRVFALAFGEKGRQLATGGQDRTVRVWSVGKREQIRELQGHDRDVRSVAFSPDGKLVVSASNDRTARIWDVEGGKQKHKLEGHDEEVFSAVFAPDGRTVLGAGKRSYVTLWDAASGKRLTRLEPRRGRLWKVRFSPDGKKLAAGGSRISLFDWPAAEGAPSRGIAGRGVPAFSPDGRHLACGDSSGGVVIVETSSGKVQSERGHFAPVDWLRLGREEEKLYTAAWDRSLRVWDAAGGEEKKKIKISRAVVAMASDGRTAAVPGDEGTVVLIDLGSGRTRAQLNSKWTRDEVTAMAFAPRAALLVAGIRGRLLCWNTVNGQLVNEIDWRHQRPSCLTFSADGRFLTGGSWDGKLTLWQVETFNRVHDYDDNQGGILAAALRPDGRMLAAGGHDREGRVWVPNSPKLVRKFGGRGVRSLAFSPDGKRLICGLSHGTIDVYDETAENRLFRFGGHMGSVNCLAFTKDGKRLISGSSDSTALVWDLARVEELARAEEAQRQEQRDKHKKKHKKKDPKPDPGGEDAEPL